MLAGVAQSLDYEDVARVTAGLPSVTEGIRHGNRTWFVAGRAFAWERPYSKADIRRFGDDVPPAGPLLAVRVADLEEKDAVLRGQPDAFFTIPHFDGYAAVLVQLRRVSRRALREAILGAWAACAPPALRDQRVRVGLRRNPAAKLRNPVTRSGRAASFE